MIVDFRKDPAPLPPVILCDSPVTSAESFCFLGTTITKELKWEQNIRSLTKKAQQRMYFLRQLKKFLFPVKMLVNFYTAIIESVLTSSITVLFAAATARDKAKLQCVIHSAEKVIGCSLPSLQELYVSRSRRRAAKITPTPLIPEMNSFGPSPLERGFGPSGPGPHATRTVSSSLQLKESMDMHDMQIIRAIICRKLEMVGDCVDLPFDAKETYEPGVELTAWEPVLSSVWTTRPTAPPVNRGVGVCDDWPEVFGDKWPFEVGHALSPIPLGYGRPNHLRREHPWVPQTTGIVVVGTPRCTENVLVQWKSE
ncbi:hypothetical protein QTP86_005348 [Hemibagrus guttatus]|nr:hypothetical protein QTP86_005348 [Hemibagrus guttatus]